MAIDGRTIESGSTFEYDVCVIGAGAAGITLGIELANANFQVALIESGGVDFDPEIQDLYRGNSTAGSYDYFELSQSRLRLLGGTTNHWSGWCRPLSASDFASHPWIPNSGWPIKVENLISYYERAQELCELGPFVYDAGFWLPQCESYPRVGSGTGLLEPTVFQYSPPTRFGRRYRERLESATNLEIFLYSNAVGFSTPTAGGWIDETKVVTLQGNCFSMRAKVHVLATGGIENARLLLSTPVIPRAGAGRARELIGRYFMDHPHVEGGIWVMAPQAQSPSFFDRRVVRGQEVQGVLSVPTHVRELYSMFGFSAQLQGPIQLDEVTSLRYSDARRTLIRLKNALTGRESVRLSASELWDLVTNPIDVIRTMWSRATGDSVRGYILYCRCEQRPNSQSRVELTRESDELGLPRVALHWELTNEDFISIQKGIELVARDIGALGGGIVNQASLDFLKDRVVGAHHHIGTTRMAHTPSEGVVDLDGRAFGTANLYVTGSSVFPTSGYANPTLTIVALAARLADHLLNRLQGA